MSNARPWFAPSVRFPSLPAPALRAAVGASALLGIILLALGLAAPRAEGFIYWAETGSQTIGRAENDGSRVEPDFIGTGELPFAVAVDASHIYWANQNGDPARRRFRVPRR